MNISVLLDSSHKPHQIASAFRRSSSRALLKFRTKKTIIFKIKYLNVYMPVDSSHKPHQIKVSPRIRRAR